MHNGKDAHFTIRPPSKEGLAKRAKKRIFRTDIIKDLVFEKVDDEASCVICGGSRPQIAIYNNDPYCSTKCCREDHKLVESPVNTIGAKTAA